MSGTETFDRLIESLETRSPSDRLMVMAQNPADRHHWSRNLATVTADELLNALRIGRAAMVLIQAVEVKDANPSPTTVNNKDET